MLITSTKLCMGGNVNDISLGNTSNLKTPWQLDESSFPNNVVVTVRQRQSWLDCGAVRVCVCVLVPRAGSVSRSPSVVVKV